METCVRRFSKSDKSIETQRAIPAPSKQLFSKIQFVPPIATDIKEEPEYVSEVLEKMADDESVYKCTKDDDKEYVTIEAKSMDEIISKVQSYSYENASNRVMTATERMIGGHVDFRG